MEKTLLVIDSYLSSLERAFCCENLISQIRKNFPNYKVLLINKSRENFGIEKKVDYYFNFGDSFMVGYPPQEFLEKKWYSRPYVYFGTSIGVLENWMPLTGMTDHVAGIYNSFILAAKFAKSMGFEKVFKFEFDTVFDEGELRQIKEEIDSFTDYIIYGKRHEGTWTTHNLIDVHIIGFSPKIFDGFDLVRNDSEYWGVCRKIGYCGKWIEYLIAAIIEKKENKEELIGISREGYLRDYYKKSKFDIINSPSGWTEKWKEIPAISKISIDGGISELQNKISLFYYNNDFVNVKVKTIAYKNDIEIYNFECEMKQNSWIYHELDLVSEIKIVSQYFSSDGYTKNMEYFISPKTINELKYRILKS